MEPLNFPASSSFEIQRDEGRPLILDAVRRKYVRLTPEEWVRQHLVRFLVETLGYPLGLLAVEKAFPTTAGPRRADLVAYGRDGQPRLIAECKAPEVKLTQSVFDQVSRYNIVTLAPHLLVTNGHEHYCWVVDRTASTYRFLAAIPTFADLVGP